MEKVENFNNNLFINILKGILISFVITAILFLLFCRLSSFLFSWWRSIEEVMRKKIRIKKLNSFQRRVFFVFVGCLTLTIGVTLGRYIYRGILDFYFRTQNFYFESDKLTTYGRN